MQDEDLAHLVAIKFLRGESANHLPWKYISNPSFKLQELILNNTVRLENIVKYPINTNYQKRFLKSFIEYLEKQESIIHDGWYEEYGRLVALPHQNHYFKHYPIENGAKNLILKENINLISEGTTGLRTWQAALALSEWIISNKDNLFGKIILELGSGIGLTGLILAECCSPKTIYLTDCHSSVLATLVENIKINNLHNKINVLNLPWEEVSREFCENIGRIDIIIAADVVYDLTLFRPLISAVTHLFQFCCVKEFILSCTERNWDTLREFLVQLRDAHLAVETIEVPPQKNLVWSEHPSVKIFRVTQHN